MAESQSPAAGGLQPVVDLTRAETNPRMLGALAPTDPQGALMAAALAFDFHDAIVTTPTVLGFASGRRFLEIAAEPGTRLADTPIPLTE